MTGVFEQALLGTAVGDSLGLPAEGLSAGRIARKWPGPWRHRLLGNRGMISDDTEHTVFVAQSLLASRGDTAVFQRHLASKLRLWLLCLPAGIGFATLRAIIKLWLGFPPSRSGVYSAGNGPAMRSAVIGVYFANDPRTLVEFVSASTRLTHTDPRAEIGAMAIALTAAWAVQNSGDPDPMEIRELWLSAGAENREWRQIVETLVNAHAKGDSVNAVAQDFGLEKGISGFVFHSVPIALYSWLCHHRDFRGSLESVLQCGGDTDTVGAMTGALAALHAPIPEEWLKPIRDYPVSRTYLVELARSMEASCEGDGASPPRFCWLLLPARNLFFLLVVLFHGFRRLIPL